MPLSYYWKRIVNPYRSCLTTYYFENEFRKLNQNKVRQHGTEIIDLPEWCIPIFGIEFPQWGQLLRQVSSNKTHNLVHRILNQFRISQNVGMITKFHKNRKDVYFRNWNQNSMNRMMSVSHTNSNNSIKFNKFMHYLRSSFHSRPCVSSKMPNFCKQKRKIDTNILINWAHHF